ncbi:MAG: YceI family protein [Planctomycetes bacterium]|nr:YceI family protein [Planctomycetota bacterium]
MNLRSLVAGCVALATLAGVAAGDSLPPRSASGKSLKVSEADAKKGTIYYTLESTSKRPSIKFTSEALNETFDGFATDIAGYAIAGPTDNPAKLAGGAWRLSVKNINTKNDVRNGHLQGGDWLDATAHPDITFELTDVTDVKLTKEMPANTPGNPKTYSATLKGNMTIKGKTNEVTIPNTSMTFIAGNEMTAKSVKGDIIALNCKYEIKLADYGVTNPVITDRKKVAEVIKISQELRFATVAPEEQPAMTSVPVATPAKPSEKPAEKKIEPTPAGGTPTAVQPTTVAPAANPVGNPAAEPAKK